MNEHEENPIRQKVLAAIRDPGARAQVEVLVERCLGATDDLRKIDETIYNLYVESGEDLSHMFNAGAVYLALADQALAGARRLEAHLQQLRAQSPVVAQGKEGELDLDFDLFGEVPAAAEGAGDIAIKDDDIEVALDVLAPKRARSGPEKLAVVMREAEAVGYGLHAQLGEFDQRFAEVCRRESLGQVLRELDDIRNALTDGILALMSTICETYIGPVDRSLLLPGHRSALEKALLVRRGMAELRRKINACNVRIQDTALERSIREFAFENLTKLLVEFMGSEVFVAMRPADRWELSKFNLEIRGQELGAARLSCEGMAKYLDSLVAINQRDVLMQHDRDLARQVRELLEAAAPLISVSPRVAAQLVKDAFEQADALFGRHDSLDALLMAWRNNPPDMDVVAQIQAAIDKLSDRVRGVGPQ